MYVVDPLECCMTWPVCRSLCELLRDRSGFVSLGVSRVGSAYGSGAVS